MTLPQDQQPLFTPPPFLGPLFKTDAKPVIEAGYLYSADETAMHGISQHRAIDFGVARGTEILVPTDGWAVCTYGEVQLTDDGQPRVITLDQALKHTDKSLLRAPAMPEPWFGWYGSYVIHIWHGNGLATQYAHVDWVRSDVPYFAPTVSEKGDLLHNRAWRQSAREFRNIARRVKKGELLATVGMTGCGWGKRCYETATFDSAGRPDFSHSDYWYWDQPHLHFMTLGTAMGPKNKVVRFWDPFGIYGEKKEGYPELIHDWSKGPRSLWL